MCKRMTSILTEPQSVRQRSLATTKQLACCFAWTNQHKFAFLCIFFFFVFVFTYGKSICRRIRWAHECQNQNVYRFYIVCRYINVVGTSRRPCVAWLYEWLMNFGVLSEKQMGRTRGDSVHWVFHTFASLPPKNLSNRKTNTQWWSLFPAGPCILL